jgi:hypothetical protein
MNVYAPPFSVPGAQYRKNTAIALSDLPPWTLTLWQGHTDGDGSSHRILTILLPEKLKWPRPPAEFTGIKFKYHEL